jgi:transcriptional regulator with XRE-family HTH domain
MQTENREKLLAKLDESLLAFRVARKAGPEADGWLRAVRYALGVPVEEVAQHLGVCRREIYRLEKSEKESRIMLGTLRQAAAALGCDLVYGLAPLEGTLREMARLQGEARKEASGAKARERLKRPGWRAVMRKTLRKALREVGIRFRKQKKSSELDRLRREKLWAPGPPEPDPDTLIYGPRRRREKR